MLWIKAVSLNIRITVYLGEKMSVLSQLSLFQANEDSESRSGHKWTLSSLWAHFAERGVDSKPVMDSIKDLIIKTVVSAEASMHAVYRPNLSSHYCGYELFGFDVLLDSKLKVSPTFFLFYWEYNIGIWLSEIYEKSNKYVQVRLLTVRSFYISAVVN